MAKKETPSFKKEIVLENFKYSLNDFENNNKEVWNHIESLSCEEVYSLLELFGKDKEIRNGLISVIKEKVKNLSLESIENLLIKIKETPTPVFGDCYVKENKEKVCSLLEKRKLKVIKRQKEDAVFPIFKEFYNNLPKESQKILNDILYRDETRYRKLRRQL